MTAGPGDPDDEGTVIIPAGQSGRPGPRPLETPPASSPEQGDGEESTAIIMPDSGIAAPTVIVPAAGEEPDPTLASSGPAQPVDLTPGTLLGNYRVGKMIARGGLGAIYDGVNIHNPAERVAIKTILPMPGLGERFAKLLLDESNALMRVRHDAVVQYRTYGRIGETDEFYLVLEYLDGDALNDFYRRRRLNERELFSLARRLATGLQAAHEEGLVHRDVSPDNVLLQNNQLEKATLIDFGIAKMGEFDEGQDAHFAGKLSYAAPEQFVRGARVGPWTDIYSLALLLIAAARGQPIPMGQTIEQAQEMRGRIPEIKGVPPSLIVPLRKMLEPHPPDRPQSMVEVIALLDEAERGASKPRQDKTVEILPQPPQPARGRAPVRRLPAAAGDEGPQDGGGGFGRSLMFATLALLLGGGTVATFMVFGDQIFGPSTPPIEQPDTPRPPEPETDKDPPVVEKTRPEQLAAIVETFRANFAAAPCNFARFTGSDMGSDFLVAVNGAWADDAAIKALAAKTAGDARANATASGETFDAALCFAADALKPAAAELGPAMISRPHATGRPDRSVSLDATPAASLPFLYLFEVDAAGQARPLLDLSADSRAALLREGRISDAGGGRFGITLAPADDKANTAQTLVVAVAAPNALTQAAAQGGALGGWAEALKTAGAKLDVMPRDGVAAQAEAPPVDKPRSELLAEARQAVAARLGAIQCNAIRIEAQDDGSTIRIRAGGVFGNLQAMQTAAAEAAAATGAQVSVDGRVIDNALCSALDGYRKVASELGVPILGTPQSAASASRVTDVNLAVSANQPSVYLFEVDRNGVAVPLLDLGTAEARAKAVSEGRAEEIGDGIVRAILTPPSNEANVDSTLLVALSAPQPPGSFSFGDITSADQLLAAARGVVAAGGNFDLVDRLGVAPPPGPAPGEDAYAEVRTSFRDITCSMIRLESAGQGVTNVFGLWGDPRPVKIAADLAAERLKETFNVAGDIVSTEVCNAIDNLKPHFRDMAPVSILSPQPTGRPDRSVSLTLIADPDYPYLYLYAIDPDGRIDSIFDFSDQGRLASAIQRGMIEAPGNGRYRVFLPPFTDDNETRSALLIALMSKDKLKSELFDFRGAIPFNGWRAQFDEFAKTVPLRLDAVEYVQVPP